MIKRNNISQITVSRHELMSSDGVYGKLYHYYYYYSYTKFDDIFDEKANGKNKTQKQKYFEIF